MGVSHLNYDQIKEALEHYNTTRTQIGILKDELQSIERTGLSAIGHEDATLEDKQTYRSELENKIFNLEKKLAIIDKAIGALKQISKEVIIRKVINDEPYYMVCGDLHIGERYARKIKKIAILKMEEIINQ